MSVNLFSFNSPLAELSSLLRTSALTFKKLEPSGELPLAEEDDVDGWILFRCDIRISSMVTLLSTLQSWMS